MAANTRAPAEQNGLGSPVMLEKTDKLFACGVGDKVALPQIVVVGDQSSGKSSVLEGLIKKPLPRDSGLCTRFATQIVFRRSLDTKIAVSIIPSQDTSDQHRTCLDAWGRSVDSLGSKEFSDIMQEVHEVMGLARGKNEDGPQKPTFSNDILCLEVSGPEQEHLSVIDVPGIFKSTTEGVTTKADIELVRNMVKSYMDNPRSIMLAVIPANGDVATQEILELASEANPTQDRTLGVLTKPDLVDRGAESTVVKLLEGQTRPMKLGWRTIRNPGQMELSDKELDRDALEARFFRSQAPWNSIDEDKVGIDALRERLKDVLSQLVKQEFPKVKNDVKTSLEKCKEKLKSLGSERGNPAEQMSYLVGLASQFQRLVSAALISNHGSDDLFESNPAL